jgi:hypothetical protein
LSAELKERLDRVVAEDCEKAEEAVLTDLPRLKALLLKIAVTEKYDVLIWMEGTRKADLNKDEEDLNLLERANLVKGQNRYTHRNLYRRYTLTKKGAETTQKLSSEP